MPEPASPPALASPPHASATRDGLLRLHGARRPWAFVPAALPWLTANPDDHHLRGLLITQFLQLGLPTPAREHAARIPAPGGAPLLHAAASLPHDQIPLEARLDALRANLTAARNGALGEFPHDMAEQALTFIRGTGSEQWLRCADGTVVVRPVSGSDERPFTLCEDGAGWARSLPLPPGAAVVYLDGLLHPAVLRRVVAACPGSDDGFLPRIVMVEPNIERFARALATQPLHDLLSRPRFDWFIGPDALSDLAASLAARGGLAISGPVLPGSPPMGAPVRSTVAAAVASACQTQEHEVNRLAATIRAPERARATAWWAARYADALSGKGERLRVLLSTTRYSTFVQHSTRDLAAALEAAGCQTHLLIEPDAASRSTNVAAGRAATTFNPDLIVCINYHRAHLGAMAPPDVPYVCWVQDAMAHLFTRDAGRALGAADFVVGHLHPEFFAHCDYPRRNTLYSPVLANDTKFHAGPVDASLAARYACEIAYVSHQSETPEACLERVKRLWAGPAASELARATEAAFAPIQAIVRAGLGKQMAPAIREACIAALTSALGRVPDDQVVNQMVAAQAHPIAERTLRHQMLDWAAALCRERSWRLHLYGRGWERHPTLAPFARGELSHDEHLRAAYQSARVHLHAGLGGVHHQRVMECALAGGCTLVRLGSQDFWLLEWWAQNSIAAGGRANYERDARVHNGTWNIVRVADDWRSMLVKCIRDRAGVRNEYPQQDVYVVSDSQRAHPWGDRGGDATTFTGAFLAGNPCDSGFWSQATFRDNASRAVESPARRASLAHWQRHATLENYTTTAFVPRLLACVRSGLVGARTPASACSPKA